MKESDERTKRMGLRGLLVGLCLLLGIGGCTSAMFPTDDVHWAKNQVAGPSLFHHPSEHSGERTILGGVILNVQASPTLTTIRLLAYPLDKKFYPDTKKPPLGSVTIEWTGKPLSTLFVQGNRIAVVGTVLASDNKNLRVLARSLSPDTCVSAGGYSCHRTGFGCICNND